MFRFGFGPSYSLEPVDELLKKMPLHFTSFKCRFYLQEDMIHGWGVRIWEYSSCQLPSGTWCTSIRPSSCPGKGCPEDSPNTLLRRFAPRRNLKWTHSINISLILTAKTYLYTFLYKFLSASLLVSNTEGFGRFFQSFFPGSLPYVYDFDIIYALPY